MTSIDWLINIYGVAMILLWWFAGLRSINNYLEVESLDKTAERPADDWPKVTVIVPASNEAENLRKSIPTLLKQNYPNLEIILINDRSTDETASVIDELGGNDKRTRTIHINELPDGWLGKVHALATGTGMSTGEWLLYTDADVHFEPDTLRLAVSHVLTRGCDHLALMPRLVTNSFWLEVAIRAFGILFLQATGAATVGKPGSHSYIGIGAFNLVRKSALERTAGFSWLRMEAIDDVGLGLLLHRTGARSCCAFGFEHLSLTWYPTVRSMFRGLEKNLFGGSRYHLGRMIVQVTILWMVSLAPFLCILWAPMAQLRFGWLAVLILLLAMGWVSRNRTGTFKDLLPTLFLPVGFLMLSLMLIRSGIMCTVRRGIIWRDTWYPVDRLRDGQRVKL